MANGLDAYEQFKKHSTGIEHNQDGEAMRRQADDGEELLEYIHDKETREGKKRVYG